MLARFRGDDGASAVEFALLLPVLILLLFGMMFGAALLNTHQTLTLAAREGARFGATFPLSEASGGDFAGWAPEVAARTRATAATDRPLTPGALSVCVRLYDVEGDVVDTLQDGEPDTCPASIETGELGELKGPRVEVTATRPGRLELGVVVSPEVTLRSTATARYEIDDLDDLD